MVDGIPLTSVPRTILDLATLGNRRQVERAIHEAEVRHLHDRLSIVDLLRRYPRRPGSRLLREVLGKGVAGVTQNDFEDLFADLIESNGLPRPRYDVPLAIGGRTIKPDCLWVGERVVVELDGRAVHDTRRKFESDRERDRLLAVSGWTVVHVTWAQLKGEPDAIASDLRRLLEGIKPASTAV